MSESLARSITSSRKSRTKKPRVFLRVVKGALVPADSCAESQLREKGYKVGDVVSAEIKKLNNPKFHRLLHRLGQLCATHLDAFSGMPAHSVLKRIQLEADICCEPLQIVMPGVGMVTVKLPESLSFENMEDGERKAFGMRFCRHISEKYWPELQPEAIEKMAENWVDEV